MLIHSIVFIFAISQSFALMMPLLPAINRLLPIEQNIILSNKNSYLQIAPIMKFENGWCK